MNKDMIINMIFLELKGYKFYDGFKSNFFIYEDKIKFFY